MSPAVLSIIIPVRNDAEPLAELLSALNNAFDLSDPSVEIIVVDGGSGDDSRTIAMGLGATVIRANAGRGGQLNAGYRMASGNWFWMLHADSLPSPDTTEWMSGHRQIGWGRFEVMFDEPGIRMWLVAFMMNLRSRLTGICTGDQGIFVHRCLLERIGGIPEQALMEDIELSRRLKRLCTPECPRVTLATSARRWRHHGWLKTVLAMWRFRFRYWSGATPETLARDYYGESG